MCMVSDALQSPASALHDSPHKSALCHLEIAREIARVAHILAHMESRQCELGNDQHKNGCYYREVMRRDERATGYKQDRRSIPHGASSHRHQKASLRFPWEPSFFSPALLVVFSCTENTCSTTTKIHGIFASSCPHSAVSAGRKRAFFIGRSKER